MSRFEAVEPQLLKKRLRSKLRHQRESLSDEEVRAASKVVCQRLDESARLAGAHRIAGYVAVRKEVDIRAYLTNCMDQQLEVCLPRVVGPGTMEFCAIQGWDELQPGAFGIDEPVGEAVPVESIDVFLVPGLAFDRRGHRLGFGKGFYDRALPQTEAWIVGVAHHWQLVEKQLPTEDHDRAVDSVVTDREWHCPSGESPSSPE